MYVHCVVIEIRQTRQTRQSKLTLTLTLTCFDWSRRSPVNSTFIFANETSRFARAQPHTHTHTAATCSNKNRAVRKKGLLIRFTCRYGPCHVMHRERANHLLMSLKHTPRLYLVEHHHLYELAHDGEHSEARVLDLGELQPLLLRRALLVEALRALRSQPIPAARPSATSHPTTDPDRQTKGRKGSMDRFYS